MRQPPSQICSSQPLGSRLRASVTAISAIIYFAIELDMMAYGLAYRALDDSATPHATQGTSEADINY